MNKDHLTEARRVVRSLADPDAAYRIDYPTPAARFRFEGPMPPRPVYTSNAITTGRLALELDQELCRLETLRRNEHGAIRDRIHVLSEAREALGLIAIGAKDERLKMMVDRLGNVIEDFYKLGSAK